jgi:hypothetical protein
LNLFKLHLRPDGDEDDEEAVEENKKPPSGLPPKG